MKRLICIFISCLLLFSCSNNSEKRKSIAEKSDTKLDSAKTESIILETVRENEKKAEQQNRIAERKRLRQEKHLQYLHIDSLGNKPIDYYLEHSEINELAIRFYNGEFLPSDNENTFNLLTVLNEKHEDIYPFYFHCLNSICMISDGALSEVLGNPCLKMVYNYPDYTFSYFKQNSTLFDKYTQFIGYELYFQNYGTSNVEISKSDFLNYLKENLNLADNEVQKLYNEFNDGIEQVKKNMED